MTRFLQRNYFRSCLNKSDTFSGSGCTCYFIPSPYSETALYSLYYLYEILYRKVRESLKNLCLIGHRAQGTEHRAQGKRLPSSVFGLLTSDFRQNNLRRKISQYKILKNEKFHKKRGSTGT
jgi:hypothetical protein